MREVKAVANRIKGITVEIGGDTTGLDKALKNVNSSITKTQSALNDVNRLLKLDPSNTVLVAQKQELLAQAVSQTEEKLSALETAQEQVAAAFARGDIGADKYQAFQREIEETRGKLNKYKADLSDLQTEQDALSQNTARLEKLFAATGTEVDDYADVLGSRLTSAIKTGTASSDQLRTALEKIGKSATGGKADIRQLTDRGKRIPLPDHGSRDSKDDLVAELYIDCFVTVKINFYQHTLTFPFCAVLYP